MLDIEYSVITSDVIKSFYCIILKNLTHVFQLCIICLVQSLAHIMKLGSTYRWLDGERNDTCMYYNGIFIFIQAKCTYRNLSATHDVCTNEVDLESSDGPKSVSLYWTTFRIMIWNY